MSLDYSRDAARRNELASHLTAPEFGVLPAVPDEVWLQFERKGLREKWIDRQIASAHIVIVLVGRQTYTKPLVRYEIAKAAAAQKPMFGLYAEPESNSTTCPSPFGYVISSLGRRGTNYPIHHLPAQESRTFVKDRIAEALRKRG